MAGLRVGDFVHFVGSSQGGRGAAVEGESVQVDLFESIAEPVPQTQCVAAWWRTPVRLPAADAGQPRPLGRDVT